MPDIYSKTYRPRGEATFGHKVFREYELPLADLALATPYTDANLEINFQGWSRQSWKLLIVNGGGAGPQASVEIQEFIANPGAPYDGDPNNGYWATKGSLGAGTADANILFEHNQEDTLRLTRLVITPTVSLADTKYLVTIEGRRDT